jgi:peroxiredoxin Q/BCP
MKRIIFLTALLLPLLAFTAGAADLTLKTGDKAPSIEGKDQTGKTWKLTDLAGKQPALVYFYPKDDTPGCTKEACGFRDGIEDFKKEGVQVLGVSFDTAESHQKFIEKYNLNFPLLVDTDGKIADAFGVRMGTGKNMAHRVSFLIAKDGTIAHITDSPNADLHLTEIKQAIAALKK